MMLSTCVFSDLCLIDYDLVTIADLPPCGKRLGVPYVRAAQESIDIQFDNFSITLSQGKECSGLETVVWDCGLLLVDLLASHNNIVKDKICLELGCGTGVVSIAAAVAGATRVVATDKILSPLLFSNIEQLKYPCVIETRILEWGVDSIESPAFYDVVLCSDVLYEPVNHPMLEKSLKLFEFGVAIFVYKVRHPREELDFFRSVSSWAIVKTIEASDVAIKNLHYSDLTGLKVVLLFSKHEVSER